MSRPGQALHSHGTPTHPYGTARNGWGREVVSWLGWWELEGEAGF
jgi:hypothetical protein